MCFESRCWYLNFKILNMSDYYFQNGWPGAIGFPLPGAARGCGCGSFPPPFPPQRDCDRGQPFFLDSAQVIYHLANNQLSNLNNLGFPNGTPLQPILDKIDYFIGFLNITQWNIPNLKTYFPFVNFQNLQQFGQAVDAELGIINANLTALSGATSTPLSSTNTDSFTFVLTGVQNKNISGFVNISSASGQTLILNSDGLYAAPQQLNVDYNTNVISISDGNSVALPNNPQGYLGNLSADPGSPQDGQYWYNTTSSQLKMRLDGATRIITIT
jgi:hypothetical protein